MLYLVLCVNAIMTSLNALSYPFCVVSLLAD